MSDDFWKKLVKGIALGIGIAAGASYISSASKTFPEHFRFPLTQEQVVKSKLIDYGARPIGILDEIKQINQIWGLLLPINEEIDLHIKAIKDKPDSFYLSAHTQTKNNLSDLTISENNYNEGKEKLKFILHKLKLI